MRMFLSHPTFVEDAVLYELRKGPCRSVDLVDMVKSAGLSSTKQGVYRALRKLRREEVITMQKGIVALSTVWLRRLHTYLAVAQKNYHRDIVLPGYFTTLEPGRKFTFTFENPELLDSYWSHVLVTLLQIVPPREHLFAYNPKYWLLLSRRDSEERFLQAVEESGRWFFMSVSGKTYLDKQAGKIMDREYCQYHMSDSCLFEKSNYYVNVIGDYVIEVYLDEAVSRRIGSVFQDAKTLDDGVVNQLCESIAEKGQNKLVLTRSRRKAEKLRRKIKKFFYIPPSKKQK